MRIFHRSGGANVSQGTWQNELVGNVEQRESLEVCLVSRGRGKKEERKGEEEVQSAGFAHLGP